jgi:endonuclease/exonuclease/phosphatase (EEP) superfamily protein YafD
MSDLAVTKPAPVSGTQLCTASLALGLVGLALARLGQLWEGFDLFSQFAAQFMMLVAASLAGLLWPGRKILAASALFLSMIIAYGAWPHVATALMGNAQSPPVGERALKLASFNMWLFNPNGPDLLAEITRLDADVMVLVEASDKTAAMLDQVKGTFPYRYICHESSVCHLAIISKVPLGNLSFKAGWKGPPMIRATLGGEFAGITVVGVHTTRFPHSRAQLRQARALAEELRTIQGPLIVMGDFNATPFSRVTQTIAQGAGLTRLTSLPTWPSWAILPQIAIDHVFASPGIRVLRGEAIGHPSGSDHFPISMVVAVPPPS